MDRRYFSEAVRWENDVIHIMKRSRLIAWLVAAISFGLACLALTCLAVLLPLKSFEPYVIEVDKTTGFMEIKQPLADGNLTQSEAIARMYVVRYLKARETYDPATVKDNFDLAQLLSTRDASRDLFALYSPSNAGNPVTRFGRETRIELKIKSIQFPNNLTAVVRFSTQRTGRDSGAEEHWVSLLHFHYSKASMPNEWRFDNPLGFQVVDYRRDQESVSEQSMPNDRYQP
ncbi:virB8 family protein [Phyllobacterium myrsinacearum]|uniref:Type IV secretion system protein virB8 n=1 Tax=Phyllobacterium myrsinacearum TaxID=28101 RepID=A0A839EL07_9HYPH|nr:type IV secretion system protein [Phyllobacterium myrsinacearum]MBA8877390.1 type IV secretion system protein VirB8 [Phyllobacterium myrsinacearum]